VSEKAHFLMTFLPTSPRLTSSSWRPQFLYGPAAGQGGRLHGSARPLQTPSVQAEALRREMLGVLQEGLRTDLAAAQHLRRLEGQLALMQPGQLENMKGLLNASVSRVEQIFILKAFAANEPWQHLVQFAQEMRGLPEAEIIRRCTMRDERDLIQQWQDSCGPTMLQVAAGEADPRYAWELNKTWDLGAIDPLGQNQAMAVQQRVWLEHYGGRAVERGQSGGMGIAIGRMLNEQLSGITGARYQTREIHVKEQALNQIVSALASGFDVPLRISWDPPNAPTDSGHFVLAMAVRNTVAGREFQIHDPWTGKSAWVAERELLADRMNPIFDKYARLTHFYQPSAA